MTDETPEISDIATAEPAGPKAPKRKRRIPALAWVAAACLVLGILIGTAIAVGESATASSQEKALHSKISGLDLDNFRLKASNTALNAESAAVGKRSAELDAREAAVKSREDAVTAKETVIAQNTFAGDGTYIVNRDIQPGRYQSAGGTTCYWERQDANGGILDNYLGAGPAVVTVRSTDATLHVSGCAPFSKVG